MADIPQLSLPLRVVDDHVLEVEQDSATDLAQRVAVLCVTPPGWLDGRPDFGLSDQAHRRNGPDLPEVERQINDYVPDVDLVAETDPSLLDQGLSRLGLRISA